MGGRHAIAAYFLCLDREDADNELGNSILIIPNDQMRKGIEKLDRMYILVTGTVQEYPIAGAGTDIVKRH